ncbi:MAG: hypothetical protein ACI8W7_002981 [Gammaproteobacteria bacterium]|jgi:hypothetical protein
MRCNTGNNGAGGIGRINTLFRNPIKYRQVIKPLSIGASARCIGAVRAESLRRYSVAISDPKARPSPRERQRSTATAASFTQTDSQFANRHLSNFSSASQFAFRQFEAAITVCFIGHSGEHKCWHAI